MIIGQTISTKMFHYHKGDKLFTQEASSLGGIKFLSLLFDDAANLGFVLKSHQTQVELAFYLDDVERDSEGDIQCWNFKPVDPNARANGLAVCIFND